MHRGKASCYGVKPPPNGQPSLHKVQEKVGSEARFGGGPLRSEASPLEEESRYFAMLCTIVLVVGWFRT